MYVTIQASEGKQVLDSGVFSIMLFSAYKNITAINYCLGCVWKDNLKNR